MDVYLEHADWVRKLARELVRDPGTAEDLVQETWLAFEKAKPDTERSLRPWLARVMRNAAAMHRRRSAGRAAREEASATPEKVGSTWDIVARAEEQRRLAGMVLALDEPYRNTLLLRFYEGFSIAQIAKVQGIPGATVRTHLRRGLERLRQRLDAENGGDRRAWALLLQPLYLASPPWYLSPALVGTLLVVLLGGTGWWWFATSQRHASDSDELLANGRPESDAADLRAPQLDSIAREAPSTSPFAGSPTRSFTLLSEATGEPLPSYSVRSEGRSWTSDANGLLTLPAEVQSIGPINLAGLRTEIADSHGLSTVSPASYKDLALPNDPSIETLLVPSGPSYALKADWPQSPIGSAFEARIAADDAGEQGLWIWELAEVQPAMSGTPWPWVRFAQMPPGGAKQGTSWQLEVRDAEGLWMGQSRVEPSAAEMDLPIPVELGECGILEGTITGAGVLRPDQANILIKSMGLQGDLAIQAPVATRRWFQVQANETGRFQARWLPPGEYQVIVELEGYESLAQTTTVEAGQTQNDTLELTPWVPVGRVAGTIESQTGGYSQQLLIFALDGEDKVFEVYPTSWEKTESGHNQASFEFPEVPTGRLNLQALSLTDLHTFLVHPKDFEGPLETARLTILDAAPMTDWWVEVQDARTLEPIVDFRLELQLEGRIPSAFVHTLATSLGEAESPQIERWTQWAGGMRWNTWNGPSLPGLPLDAAFTWTLRAPGYAEESGTQADLEPTSEGHRRLLRMLQPL